MFVDMNPRVSVLLGSFEPFIELFKEAMGCPIVAWTKTYLRVYARECRFNGLLKSIIIGSVVAPKRLSY
jgi:hypothetical protein